MPGILLIGVRRTVSVVLSDNLISMEKLVNQRTLMLLDCIVAALLGSALRLNSGNKLSFTITNTLTLS